MANVQKYFEQFHEKVRIDYDMSDVLRDKRDILVGRINEHLTKNGRPVASPLGQGSYSMKTGVKPIEELEFDIDVALRFGVKPEDYSATEVRRWILEAVEGHTDRVEDKKPCIRVGYADGYHVDLVSYACWTDAAGQEQFRLAHKASGWRPADPPQLLEYVNTARKPFEGTEDNETKTDQFRRSVRYLRRWDDEAVPKVSSAKPTGLAYVLLCAKYLQPRLFVGGSADDRGSLHGLSGLCATFAGRLEARKPTPEHEEMFGRLSGEEMNGLKSRFGGLTEALRKADAEPDPVKACEILYGVFGRDFPIPKPDDTGEKTRGPAIVTSSASA
jgi:hypothetical protein